MKETLQEPQPSKLSRLAKSLKFIFGSDDPSEDLDWLMAEGHIEQLVREGRAPLQTGKIGTPGGEMQPYYQVPPKGFEPTDLKDIYSTQGCYVFVHKTGKQRIGATFTLTDKQQTEVEIRIKNEQTKLASQQKTNSNYDL